MDFYGFPRSDGSVGVRNFIGILLPYNHPKPVSTEDLLHQ